MSNSASFLLIGLQNLVFQSPVLIAYLVGLGLALARWQRHPRVSMFASLGFALAILSSVGFALVFAYLGQVTMNSAGTSTMRTMYPVFTVVRGLIMAAAHGLVVAAIFAGRSNSPQNLI